MANHFLLLLSFLQPKAKNVPQMQIALESSTHHVLRNTITNFDAFVGTSERLSMDTVIQNTRVSVINAEAHRIAKSF